MGVPRGETKVNKREEKCCKCSKYWNEMKAFLRCMGNTSEIIFEGKQGRCIYFYTYIKLESQNHLIWNRPLRSLSHTVNLTRHHVVQPPLQSYLQRQWPRPQLSSIFEERNSISTLDNLYQVLSHPHSKKGFHDVQN